MGTCDGTTIGFRITAALLYVAVFYLFASAGGFVAAACLLSLLFLPLMYLFAPFLQLGGALGGLIGWLARKRAIPR